MAGERPLARLRLPAGTAAPMRDENTRAERTIAEGAAMASGSDRSAGEATWAVHFPGNLRWTNAMQIVKGMVPYGAVAMAEIDLIAQRLEARAGETDLDRVWQ